MAPNPNAWWSSDFANEVKHEAKEELLQPIRKFRKLPVKQQVARLLFIASILAIEMSLVLFALVMLLRISR